MARKVEESEQVAVKIKGLVRTARSVKGAEQKIKTAFPRCLVWVQAWGEHTFGVLIMVEPGANNEQVICPRERAATLRDYRRFYGIGRRRRGSQSHWKRERTAPEGSEFMKVVDCEVMTDTDGSVVYTGKTREWLDRA